MLPQEMIKEFIGKVCFINVFDSATTSYYRIIAVENNWIKVRNFKGVISMINGEMIKSIEIADDKYQDKCQ